MDNPNQNNQPSRRTLLIGLAAAVGLILFITVLAVVVLFFGGNKQQNNTTTDTKTVTKETIEKNITDASASMQQAKSDQEAARAAIQDSEKRTKLSN